MIEAWRGAFGDGYTKRQPNDIPARTEMWEDIFNGIPTENLPGSILEVGANQGLNLDAFPYGADLFGLEPNKAARRKLQEVCTVYPDTATNILMGDGDVDLAFTCGVLIHIPPKEWWQACSEIVRVSNRYVLAIEYFSAETTEREYRGKPGLMWTADFGQIYMEQFKLKLLDYGFFWKPATGLDNLTWWLFEK